MSREIPEVVRAAAGLAATVLDEARKLPETLPSLPVRLIGLAMQQAMKVQQHYAGLVARGDELFTGIRGENEPGLATFDDDEPAAAPAPSNGFRDSAFDRVGDRLTAADDDTLTEVEAEGLPADALVDDLAEQIEAAGQSIEELAAEAPGTDEILDEIAIDELIEQAPTLEETAPGASVGDAPVAEDAVVLELALLESDGSPAATDQATTGTAPSKAAKKAAKKSAPAKRPAKKAAAKADTTDTAATDTAATDTAATDTAATDTAATDTAATDTAATDTAASDTKATDTAARETAATETAATETKAADTAATDTNAGPATATDESGSEVAAATGVRTDVGQTDTAEEDAAIAQGAAVDAVGEASTAPTDEPQGGSELSGSQAVGAAPVDGYDSFTIAQLRGRLRGYALSTVQDLVAYEEATRTRPEYLRMLRNRLEKLEEQAVESSPFAPRGA
jgi:hypothetical protein